MYAHIQLRRTVERRHLLYCLQLYRTETPHSERPFRALRCTGSSPVSSPKKQPGDRAALFMN